MIVLSTVKLTDGTTVELLKYKSFLCNGEKYTVFLDPELLPEDDAPAELFLLKNEPDGSYSVPDNKLTQKLLPFLVDLSAGGSHYFGQSESGLDIQELEFDK